LGAKLEEQCRDPDRADFLGKTEMPGGGAFDEVDEFGELEDDLAESVEELVEELPSLCLVRRLLGLTTQGKGLTTTEVGAMRASAFLGGV
jgi:hypothetical protein